MPIGPLSQPGASSRLPTPPISVSASAVAGGGATVAFTASENPGKPSGDYVATSSPGGVAASAASSPITFNAGTLTAAQAYTFTVVKQSGSGITSDPSTASGSITAFYVPSAPTITSSSAGDGFLDISFTAGSANGSTITNYQYATSTNGTSYTAWTAFSPTDTTSPVRITGLSNGTNYYVKIRAVNSAGSGAESNVFRDAVNLTTQPFGVPLSPSITLSNGCDTATWSFSATANGRTISKYGYQISTNGGSTWGTEQETTSSSYSRTVSTDTNSYVVRVRAYNEAGAGAYSSASSATTARTDAGLSTVFVGSSCTRTSFERRTFTRSGCADRYIDGAAVSNPDCTNTSDTTCWNSPTTSTTSTYSGSCNTRTRTDTTVTTWTPKAGNTCATRTSTSSSTVNDPDCGACCGSCWTEVTQNYAGQSNFVFAGIVFDSVDAFGLFAGLAVRRNDPNCGGADKFGGYRLYSSSCGGQSAQGPSVCCC